MSLMKDVRKEITAGSNITGLVTIPIGTKVKIISIFDDDFMIKRDHGW